MLTIAGGIILAVVALKFWRVALSLLALGGIALLAIYGYAWAVFENGQEAVNQVFAYGAGIVLAGLAFWLIVATVIAIYKSPWAFAAVASLPLGAFGGGVIAKYIPHLNDGLGALIGSAFVLCMILAIWYRHDEKNRSKTAQLEAPDYHDIGAVRF